MEEDTNEEIASSDGNQVRVENVDGEGGEHRGQTDSIKAGVDSSEHTNVTSLEKLTEGELEEHHWETEEHEGDQVGDEPDTTTPFEGKVGESPEVTETNGGSDSGEDEGG